MDSLNVLLLCPCLSVVVVVVVGGTGGEMEGWWGQQVADVGVIGVRWIWGKWGYRSVKSWGKISAGGWLAAVINGTVKLAIGSIRGPRLHAVQYHSLSIKPLTLPRLLPPRQSGRKPRQTTTEIKHLPFGFQSAPLFISDLSLDTESHFSTASPYLDFNQSFFFSNNVESLWGNCKIMLPCCEIAQSWIWEVSFLHLSAADL